MKKENTKKRITWLDSLKGIAILAIVMIHSGAGSLPTYFGAIGNIGKFGVQLFFIISVYFSMVSYSNYSKENKCKNFKQIIPWYKEKIVKLIPLYYLSLVLSIIIMDNNSYWLGSEGHITILNFLSHIFFVHGFFPHYINSIITVEWFLSILVLIYLITPLIYKYITNLSKSITSFVLFTIICELIKSIITNSFIFETDKQLYYTFINDFLFVNHLPVILLGVILYFALKNDFDKVENKKTLSYSLLLISIILIVGEILFKNSSIIFSDKTRFGLYFLIIILSQRIHPTKLIDNIVFNYIGKYTYPIYLFHKLIIYLYDKFLHISIVNHLTISWLIKYVLVVSISLGLSILLIKYIDKPINKYLNKKYNQ